ncbi:MAG: DNA polymerase III subunit alpha, partial [Candidatus Poribacteria bacterium]|nr:DNA polymerase III subunit alpha [Candidatus Poribacteria bacterium]
MEFVHLNVHSAYSLTPGNHGTDGASDVNTLVDAAASLGLPALALTDRDSLAGAVELQVACKRAGIHPILGAQVTLDDGTHVNALVENTTGYENLCDLLTESYSHNERGQQRLSLDAFEGRAEGLICLTGDRWGCLSRRTHDRDAAAQLLDKLIGLFGRGNVYVELLRTLFPGDETISARLIDLAEYAGAPTVATNAVRYAHKRDFPLYDALTCARVGCRIEDPHPERPINAEQYLKSANEMSAFWEDHPEAYFNTLRIAERIGTVLIGGESFLPRYRKVRDGQSAARVLIEKVEAGAVRRYGTISPGLRQRIDHEVNTAIALGYPDQILIAADQSEVSAEKGWGGVIRGSFVNCVMAYCLNMTPVDAYDRDLEFARCMSVERSNRTAHGIRPLDIDFDYAREIQPKVVEWMRDAYGDEFTGGLAAYHSYRGRGAVRNFGKVYGFREGEIDVIAKKLRWLASTDNLERVLDEIPELRALKVDVRRYHQLIGLCRMSVGLPHTVAAHSSGLVITGRPIRYLSPLLPSAKGLPILQIDKVSLEDVGVPKYDILSLATLGAIDGALASIHRDAIRNDRPPLTRDTIPHDDPDTFDLMRTGDTVGMFQFDSPAQMSVHSQGVVQNYDDMVKAVAVVRPAPIGLAMHRKWIDAKLGRADIRYLIPELNDMLAHTDGALLFQGDLIRIVERIAGMSPGEADVFRRAMNHSKLADGIDAMRETFFAGGRKNGYPEDGLEEIWEVLNGYKGYGFCQGHAEAFADHANATAYLATHYPAEMLAGMMDEQPAGHWACDVLVGEARRRGIKIFPLDINLSEKQFKSKPYKIRVGWKAVRGLTEATLERIAQERQLDPFSGVVDFVRRVQPRRDELYRIAQSGAFDSMHPRRPLMWAISEGSVEQINGGNQTDLGLAAFRLPDIEEFTEIERFRLEVGALGFSVRWHPLDFYRDSLRQQGVVTTEEA